MGRKLVAVILLLALLGAGFYFALRGGFLRGVTQRAADVATTGKVRSAFALSKRLSAYEIGVETQGGVITLAGQVPSEIDRELAVSVARDVPGVRSVEDGLRVEPGLKPSEASLREGARVADLEIRAELRERLAASQELREQKIQVGVADRIVTLDGEVETPPQKAGAEQLARGVSHVAQVVNNLAVRNPAAAQSETPGVSRSPEGDEALDRRVLFALFTERENFADLRGIKVTSRDGRVTLSGPVASRAERALAERIARAVTGVSEVSNQLTVGAV